MAHDTPKHYLENMSENRKLLYDNVIYDDSSTGYTPGNWIIVHYIVIYNIFSTEFGNWIDVYNIVIYYVLFNRINHGSLIVLMISLCTDVLLNRINHGNLIVVYDIVIYEYSPQQNQVWELNSCIWYRYVRMFFSTESSLGTGWLYMISLYTNVLLNRINHGNWEISF